MPFRAFLGIGWMVGALFLVYGIQTAITAMQKDKKDGWMCVLGVLSAILGVWITFSGVQRMLTDMTIAFLVLCGVLALIVGVFAVGHPIMTMISVGYIIAIDLMVQGITMIVASCMIKKSE